MGCCGKQRKVFKKNIVKAKSPPPDPRNILDIPVEELSPVHLRAKNRIKRIANRTARIKRRNERKAIDQSTTND